MRLRAGHAVGLRAATAAGAVRGRRRRSTPGSPARRACDTTNRPERSSVGPRPSRASVEAGAVTQFWVKKLSPISNSRRSSLLSVGAENENALRPTTSRVVSPPRAGSSESGSSPPHAATTTARIDTAPTTRRRRRVGTDVRDMSDRDIGRVTVSTAGSTIDEPASSDQVTLIVRPSAFGGAHHGRRLRLERLDRRQDAGATGVAVGHTLTQVLVERRRNRLDGRHARGDLRLEFVGQFLILGRDHVEHADSLHTSGVVREQHDLDPAWRCRRGRSSCCRRSTSARPPATARRRPRSSARRRVHRGSTHRCR